VRDLPPTAASIALRAEALRGHAFEFFAVATEANLAQFDLEPLGVALEPVPILGPSRQAWDAGMFVKLFHSMDTHVFGARDLTMPNWVLVDHALLSSGLIVIASRPENFDVIGRDFGLTSDERYVLTSLKAEAEDHRFTGPIPLASYCAAPTADHTRRVGWSLCSVVPRSGLAFLVKALALAAYGARVLSGTTQYDNPALRVHTKFGPARLVAAAVDIHTAPHTLVYETDVQEWLDSGADLPVPVSASYLVSSTDSKAQFEMQEKIDCGSHHLTILPPGLIVRDGERFVPILETETESEGGA
jgi:hypothetical protein